MPQLTHPMLILGATGQIGHFLLPLLLNTQQPIIALSRADSPPFKHPQLSWLQGDLYHHVPSLPKLAAIISLGPLDGFVSWFEQTNLADASHVIAISSMSVVSKQHSPHPDERLLAETLLNAEQRLANVATAHGAAWTIFRPTLIYGAGLDRSLTPLATFGNRWHLFPRLLGATGLRQPVHAEDLACACFIALNNPSTFQKKYALGGDERLPFAALLERVRVSLPVRAIPLPIPQWTMRLGLAGLRGFPQFRHLSSALLDRLQADLLADNAPATIDFNWQPRPFLPTADCWVSKQY